MRAREVQGSEERRAIPRVLLVERRRYGTSGFFDRRRRNGSGIVSGDIRREVVRDEPRADRHVLPGRDEEVPKGNMVQAVVVHLSTERLPVGQFLFAKVKSTSDEATQRA